MRTTRVVGGTVGGRGSSAWGVGSDVRRGEDLAEREVGGRGRGEVGDRKEREGRRSRLGEGASG